MKLFIANWKMYLTDDEAVALASEIAEAAETAACEVAIAPSFTALRAVAAALDGSKAQLAAQDCHWETKGAWTGEISPGELKEAGCHYVLVGHSERRTLGETDAVVAKKLAAALNSGLTPVLCVGETKEERDAGERDAVVRRQIEEGMKDIDAAHGEIVIAYEPRWAISAVSGGATCAPEDAADAHRLIRGLVPDTRVLFGGSVDGRNIASYISLPEVDGVLVGGASTKRPEIEAMFAKFS